jgi:hypothetical protein
VAPGEASKSRWATFGLFAILYFFFTIREFEKVEVRLLELAVVRFCIFPLPGDFQKSVGDFWNWLESLAYITAK